LPTIEDVAMISPETLRDHVGSDGPHGLEHSGEVGLHHVRPGLVGDVDERDGRHDARVGQQDVDLAELRNRAVDHCLHLRAITNVGLHGEAALVVFLDQLHRLAQIIRMRHRVWHGFNLRGDVADDDIRAFAGERHRLRAALTPRSARDQRDLAVEPSHVLLL
jgi:hypothetical protein